MPPSSDFKQVKMETKSRTFLFGKIFNQRSNNFQESCAKLDQLWGHISKAVYLSTGHLWGSGSKFQLSKVTSDYSKATKLKKKFDIFPEYPPHLSRIFIGGERDVASHAQYLPGQTFTNLQTRIHTVDQRDKTLSSFQKDTYNLLIIINYL